MKGQTAFLREARITAAPGGGDLRPGASFYMAPEIRFGNATTRKALPEEYTRAHEPRRRTAARVNVETAHARATAR